MTRIVPHGIVPVLALAMIILVVIVSACNTPYSQNPLRELIPAPSSELGLSFWFENEGVSGGVYGSGGVVSRYEQGWHSDDTKLYMEVLEFNQVASAASYVDKYGPGGLCDQYIYPSEQAGWLSSWSELAQVDKFSWCREIDYVDDTGNVNPSVWDGIRLQSGRYVVDYSVEDDSPMSIPGEDIVTRPSRWKLLLDQLNATIPKLLTLSQ